MKKVLLIFKSFLRRILPDWIFERIYHAIFWPILGSVIYRAPSGRIKVIGVTGTNGKTTVVHLASRVLEGAGFKVASISSLRFKIGGKEWKNKLKMTMPGRLKMQKFLRRAVNAKCDYVVLEVTSEGIKQNRHRYIKFHSAVFTNLTQEHIESHGGFDNYKLAKSQLFRLPHKISIVNGDDNSAEYFLNFDAKEKIVYSINEEYDDDDETVIAQKITVDSEGIKFEIDDQRFELRLLGEFNIYNALCAICIGLAENIKLKTIADILKVTNPIPGRMEKVIGEPFGVFVDYAHTPDALEKALKTISEFKTKKIILVTGAAGGGRDKWKRPEFAKIGQKYADYIVITNEDPYKENPETILDEIASGFSEVTSSKLKILRILDRRKAINKALQLAKDDDVVLVAGKGAEPIMVTKEGPVEWDDRNVVREEFAKLYL